MNNPTEEKVVDATGHILQARAVMTAIRSGAHAYEHDLGIIMSLQTIMDLAWAAEDLLDRAFSDLQDYQRAAAPVIELVPRSPTETGGGDA
jgi:hypothetical protein